MEYGMYGPIPQVALTMQVVQKQRGALYEGVLEA